jgi:TonB family protein
MKTNLTNTKRITALVFTIAIVSSALTAQSSYSNTAGKFASLVKERKSTLAYERLEQLTSAIEEKVKFRAPSVNDNENTAAVLTDLSYSAENQGLESTLGYSPALLAKERTSKKEKTINDTASFRNWVKANLKNELGDVDKAVTGRVVVAFTVDENGHVSDAKIVSPSDKEVDHIVLDVINDSPKWAVKEMDNKPVKQSYTMPIKYKVKKY